MPDPQLIGDLIELARIPAPTFAESPRIDWLEHRLRGAPGELHRDQVGNLIWSWGSGRPELLVAAHVDTVFDEATPLEPKLDGDTLVGPGVGDNAAAIAVAIQVVERLLARVALAPGAVAFTVGEEGLGNLRGMLSVCERLRPRAAIALEGHGLDSVIVDAVGSVRAKVIVSGPGGHSWVDRGRPSAIHACLELGVTLTRAGSPSAPVNIGLLRGGRSVNAIADHTELTVERRALDQSSLMAFEQELERLAVPAPLDLGVEIVGRRPAGQLTRDAPLLRAVLRARAALALEERLEAGSTDANAALALEIPALALGVTRGRGMHTLAEEIALEPLALGAQQLEMILLDLLVSDIRREPEKKAVIT